jgi:hypothetical protein
MVLFDGLPERGCQPVSCVYAQLLLTTTLPNKDKRGDVTPLSSPFLTSKREVVCQIIGGNSRQMAFHRSR